MKHILSLLILCLLLAGCAPKDTSFCTAGTPIQTPTGAVATVPELGAPQIPATLYLPDDQAQWVRSETVTLSECTAEALIAQLAAHQALPESVQVRSFSQEGQALSLDLSQEFGTYLSSMGTAGEYVTLASLTNTLLTALDADSLTLTVEGSILETGHAIYDFPLQWMPDPGA